MEWILLLVLYSYSKRRFNLMKLILGLGQAKRVCEASKHIGESECELVFCETFELVDCAVLILYLEFALLHHWHLSLLVLIGLAWFVVNLRISQIQSECNTPSIFYYKS